MCSLTEILMAVKREPPCPSVIGTASLSLTFVPLLLLHACCMSDGAGRIDYNNHCASLSIFLKCISMYFINLNISDTGSYYRPTHMYRGWKSGYCIAERKDTLHSFIPIKTEMNLSVKTKRITRSSREFRRKKQTTIDICTNIRIRG